MYCNFNAHYIDLSIVVNNDVVLPHGRCKKHMAICVIPVGKTVSLIELVEMKKRCRVCGLQRKERCVAELNTVNVLKLFTFK